MLCHRALPTAPYRSQCDIFLALIFSGSVQFSLDEVQKRREGLYRWTDVSLCRRTMVSLGCMTAAGHWMDIRLTMWMTPSTPQRGQRTRHICGWRQGQGNGARGQGHGLRTRRLLMDSLSSPAVPVLINFRF